MMQIKSIHKNGDESCNPINDLRQRVEELENEQFVTDEQVNVLLSIIKILAELPPGKQILNRALNLRELDKLQHTILPRRQEDLKEILSMKMPEGIREEMSTRQIKLIQSTLRHVTHRRQFETHSAKTVRSIMETFFKKLNKKSLIYGGQNGAPNR